MPPFPHEDFVYALAQMDSFIDVSEEDLLRISQFRHGPASCRRRPGRVTPIPLALS